jgi:hypothetical protein
MGLHLHLLYLLRGIVIYRIPEWLGCTACKGNAFAPVAHPALEQSWGFEPAHIPAHSG